MPETGDSDLFIENDVAYCRTQVGIAGLLGVNRRTVADYVRQGMPGSPGRYPTAEVIHWWLERQAGEPLCRECKRPLRGR